MSEKRVSLRYARAINNIAVSKNIQDKILEDLSSISKTMDSSRDLYLTLTSPIVIPSIKINIIKKVFETKVEKTTLDFLITLINKKRANFLPNIIEVFNTIYNTQNNRIIVDITSAIEIDYDTKKQIESKLEEITKKIILPNYNVDSEIKGGLKINIEGWVFDSTISNKLRRLYNTIKSA